MDLDLNEAVEETIALPELDNMLAELDTVEEIVEEAVEAAAPIEEMPEELSEEFLADLEIATAKQSIYESQAAEAMPDIAETVDGTTAASIKTKKARTTSKAAAEPRAPRDMANVPAKFFVLSNDLPEMEEDDMVAHKTAVMSKRPAQVKIAEKFDNLFMQISAGKKPSTYVMLAYDLLKAKGEFSSADLIAHYKVNGLGDGTARSQTGQIMVLFDVVGLATRAGQKMTACKNSSIADRLDALLAPAPTPAA